MSRSMTLILKTYLRSGKKCKKYIYFSKNEHNLHSEQPANQRAYTGLEEEMEHGPDPALDKWDTLKQCRLLNSSFLSTSPGQPAPRAQQRLHFLRLLRKRNAGRNLLVAFYQATIASLLTFCLSVWYTSCSATDKRAPQRGVRTAGKITGSPSHSLEDGVTSRFLSGATHIIRDSTHPGHNCQHLAGVTAQPEHTNPCAETVPIPNPKIH